MRVCRGQCGGLIPVLTFHRDYRNVPPTKKGLVCCTNLYISNLIKLKHGNYMYNWMSEYIRLGLFDFEIQYPSVQKLCS